MDDIRALISDDAYACSFQSLGQYRAALLQAVDRAAQPELEALGELGDEELWAIWNEHDGPIPMILRAAIAADRARAALAEPEPEPPADGEVADLVLFLKENAEDALADECPIVAGQFTRAADLLERLASPACLVVNPPPEAVQALKAAGPGRIELMPADPPQPVPLSERLPGPGDCDEEGRCWWWRSDGVEEFWELICLRDPIGHNSKCAENVSYGYWLPVHALLCPGPSRRSDFSA